MRTRLNKIVALFILAAAISSMAATVHAVEPTLTWYGHAAFKYTTTGGKIILIDPWLTNPKAPKNINLKHVDAILITHGHSDHVGEAFELAKKFNAPIIASYELTEIAKSHGVANVMPLNPNGSATLGTVTVTAVPAVHSSSYKEGDTSIYAGAPLGFIIQEYGGPATLYHAGDTGLFSDMSLIARLYSPQIAMLPIGGGYTMKPAEAAYAAKMLQVRTIIPMHYGTFPALAGTPAELKQEMTHLGVPSNVREMVPGKEMKIKDLL